MATRKGINISGITCLVHICTLYFFKNERPDKIVFYILFKTQRPPDAVF